MVSDLDIYRTAKLLIDSRGAGALDHGREMIGQMAAKGDAAGAATWRRTIAAIGALRGSSTGHRH